MTWTNAMGPGVSTVNAEPLLGALEAVTTTFPVVAPAGTETTMLDAVQLEGVAALPLKVTVLVPCVAPKLAPVIVTDVPTNPDTGFRLVMVGVGAAVTVKATPLPGTPAIVTTMLPVVAPTGTGTAILDALQLVGDAGVPLKVIVLVPCVTPKLAPVIVTLAPTKPDTGLRLVIDGAGSVTVKLTLLLAAPATVTKTLPDVAAAGTGTAMLVGLQLVGAAAAPLKETVLVPWAAPKFVPVMVMLAPTNPEAGFRLVILGAGTVTVKLTPLLLTPPTATTTLPVVAPTGTGTAILDALQLVGDAGVPLKVTVLVPWVAPKLAPVIVMLAPTNPDTGFRLVMVGAGTVIVKLTPLLLAPPTDTTTLPVVAPAGTGAVILDALQLVGDAGVPLKETVLVPCVAPKLAPVIVTLVPTNPDTGFRLVMLGAGAVTVKVTVLLATPPTETATLPVVAPAGTGAVILDALQLVGDAGVPLKETVLVPCVAPKLAPVIVTLAPTNPDAGFRLVMLGAGTLTVKLTPLLATPPTVTRTLPVVAPAGTGAVILVVLQLVGDAAVPLKVTMLVPWVAPKLAPVIVTLAPTNPDAGLRLVMLGAGTLTAKLTPLLGAPPTVTRMLPVVAPVGTDTAIVDVLQFVGDAAVPLKVMVLVPCVAPKLAPVIETLVPTNPDEGFRLVMLGGGTVTVKGTPLLATPGSVSTILPVVAPLGTGTTTRVAVQLVGVAATPLKDTVPTAVPKFVPVIVTDVPTAPEAGLILEIFGTGAAAPLALNPAKIAPQLSEDASEACAASEAGAAIICCSANSFVPGSLGTFSTVEKPLVTVMFAELAVAIAPSNKSAPVVVTLPLFGDAPFPWAMAVTSRELEVAIPEYSTIAKRRVDELVSDTAMLFEPPAMFSA